MLMNQTNHQDSLSSNLRQLKSSPGPLLPAQSLWFSAITGKLNHHAIDNSDVKLSPLYFQVEFNYESIPDPDTAPIKSNNDCKIDHLLELFHSENDEDLLGVELQIIQP